MTKPDRALDNTRNRTFSEALGDVNYFPPPPLSTSPPPVKPFQAPRLELPENIRAQAPLRNARIRRSTPGGYRKAAYLLIALCAAIAGLYAWSVLKLTVGAVLGYVGIAAALGAGIVIAIVVIVQLAILVYRIVVFLLTATLVVGVLYVLAKIIILFATR